MIDPGEQCDVPNGEDCNNGVDDDGDLDVDCADPDCASQADATCGEDCTLDQPCTGILRGVGKISFSKNGAPGRMRVRGKWLLASTIDPFAEGLTFSLRNTEGDVYSGSLVPGDLVPSGKRWSFKDDTARIDGVGTRNGIGGARLKRSSIHGLAYAGFILTVYGDFSAATLPEMTTQIVIGDDTASETAAWLPLKNGWKLPAKH